MNEEAIKDAYNLFVRTGYTQDINAFKQLIGSNPEALQDAYNLFVRTGYNQDINTFKGLMGVGEVPQEDLKKKGQSDIMGLPLDGSLSVSQSQDNAPDFFKSSVESITRELINETEEIVVPKLQYQFGPMGFKFEESGWYGDYMKVTTPDGKVEEFSLDPYFDTYASAEAKRLKKFISDNTKISGLTSIENQYKEENQKFLSDDDVNAKIKSINDEADAFKNEMNSFLNIQKSLEAEKQYLESLPMDKEKDQETLNRISQFVEKNKSFNKLKEELQQKQSSLESRANILNTAVGKYTAMKSEQGTLGGAIVNEFLIGSSLLGPSVINFMTDIGAEMMSYDPSHWDGPKAEVINAASSLGYSIPETIEIKKDINDREYVDNTQHNYFNIWYSNLNEEQKNNIENKVRDTWKKRIKWGYGGDIGAIKAVQESYKNILGTSTTKEFIDKVKDDNIVSEALIGVARSLPAMIGGGGTMGWVQRGFQMYGQATDAIYEEMANNPKFKDISENEKRLIATPIGIAEAALETIGLRNVIANKGLLNRAILSAIGKSGATTTAKTFGELVQNEIKSKLLKGGLTLAGAALAEAETGAAQQISEYAFKDIYNALKDKKLFQNPEFLSKEYFSDIGRASAAEAIGGLVLGVPTAISTAYRGKGFQAMNNDLFKVFEAASKDENIQKAFVTDLKLRVSKGEITLAEAKETLNNYRNSIGLFNSLPENLTTNQKKDAMNLLKERKDLESQIQGKDDALTTKQRNRIAAINEELNNLSEEAANNVNATLPSGMRIIINPNDREEFDNLTALYNKINRLKEKYSENLRKENPNFTDEEIDSRTNEAWQNTAFGLSQQKIIGQMQSLDINAETKILSTVESLTSALQALPLTQKIYTTFVNNNGETVSIDGNENQLAELYQQAASIPETERSNNQQEIIDTITVSLKTPLSKEQSKNWIDGLDDSREITMEANSREEIPDMFRDRAEATAVSESMGRKKILGIPIGRKGVEIKQKYTYKVTGAEIKQNRALFESLREPRAATQIAIEQNVIRSLRSIYPDVDVVYARNEEEMRRFVEEDHGDVASNDIIGGTGGLIVFNSSGQPASIYLNSESSDATTLPHEVWHAIFFKAFGNNTALFEDFRNELTKILTDSGYESIVTKLNAFADTDKYKNSNSQAEEWLAQFGGYLVASGLSRDNIKDAKAKALLIKLKNLFNKFSIRIIGSPVFLEDATPDTILDFMISFSDRMSRGESLADLFREGGAIPVSGRTIMAQQTGETGIKDLANNIEQQYGVSVDLFQANNGDITLSSIVIPDENRGKGIGNKVMNDIINYADNNGNRILLTPSKSLGATSIERLKSFYKELGFVDNKGANKDFTTRESMYRNPLSEKRKEEEREGQGGVSVKPQIVGEGARLTDEIRADLKVAQQMEASGKNVRAIRLATGWEKGADGKWRYETPDNIPFLRDVVRLVMNYMKENKVEDNVYQKAEYFLPPELMSLYPELNDVTIQFDKGDGKSLGEYNPLTNKIRVTIDDSPLKSVSIKNTISTLLHEVQHAIQEIEGFAKGGNPEGFKPDDTIKDYKRKVVNAIINNRFAKQKYRDINDARNYLIDLLTLDVNGDGMPIGKLLNDILQDIDKMYDTVLYGGDKSDFNDYLLSDIYDFLNEKKVPENKVDEIVKQFDKFETAVNEIGESIDFQEIQDNVFEQIEDRPRNKYDFYKRLAGEVESRNVQARMNMTPEERREITLQETEDIERKKQIVKPQAGETGFEKTAPKAESLKNIDVKLVRTLSRAGKRVSKGLSISTKNNKKVVQEAPELSLQYVKENAPKLFIKNANLIKDYPIIKGIKEFGNITTVEQAQEVYDIFTRQIADNLKYLMDNFKDDLRDIATLWYDGANILAQNLGKQYGITTEQAAGMIASLSPQKDWYQNVRLAELVMMAFKDNPVMTDEMVNKQREILDIGLEDYIDDVAKAEAAFKKSRSQKRAEKLKEAREKLQEVKTKGDKVIAELANYIGTDMNTAPKYLKPYYARLYHEINTTKDYNILSPDGNVLGIAKKKGGENSKVAWGSYTEIGKAVDIYLDGSQENITRTLGEMHKIRNFYNNIIDPMSPDKDVTMDTHAVAAALLLPLSGKAKQVKANFGTGTANSAPLGIKGLYYAFAEGYNLAAEESGLLPRQVQSITWEAVRGLFTDEFKRNSEKVAEINGIVNEYANKKITLDETRKQIFAAAGGINTPSWATGGPVQDGLGEDTEAETVRRGSKRVGPDTVGTKRKKPRVKSQIPSEGESLFRTENDANIGFQYDTDKVARERFNIYRLKKIGSGSDRVVFDLGEGKVLKVAKTARGLQQNIYEGDAFLTIIPNIYERGLNYVVVEKANRIKASDIIPIYNEDGEQIGTENALTMFGQLKRFNQRDFDSHNEKLQEVLTRYGLNDIMSYNVLWGDFTAMRNWGYKDGMPIHIDGGTLGGVDMLKSRPSKSLTDPEFREIYEKSKKAKKEFSDTDVYTKFQTISEPELKEVQRIGRKYNINIYGFAPSQINDRALANEISKYGLSVKRAKVDAYGRGGGVFMVDSRGRFYNPYAPRVKASRINLGASRLVDTGQITDIPGYQRMLDEANGIIDRSRRRGHSSDRIMKAVMAYVMGSAVYTRANDSQREQLVRNVQTEFGKRLKSAPSAGRLLGTINDIKKITLTDKQLLAQQIKSLARGARTAIAAWRKVSRELASEIRELVISGKITNSQAASVIRRLSNVNMFNQDSIDKFVEYMSKVFEDANYAEKINRARKLLSTAKANLKTKLGIANAVVPDLQKLFAINPNLIPDSVLEKYLSILEMIGKRASVLELANTNDISNTVNDILDAVDQEISLAETLAIRFDNYPDKVFDNNGNLDYAATLKSMVDSGQITKEDAELMQKYKSLIIPRVEAVDMTDAEIEAEKNILISAINDLDINIDGLPTREERQLARQFVSLLEPDILRQLSLPHLRNVIKLIDNINNGYLPHYAELTVERLDSFKNSDNLVESIQSAKPLSFSKIYARLKNIFTKKGADTEMIRRSPLYYIDQVFGDFKTKKIFESIFQGISEAQSLFDSEIGKVNKLLDEAHESVAKSFKYNSNKTLMSSYKMMAYMLQLEYNSNPGNNQVHQASKVIKATIKLIDGGKTKYGEREANMLQEILNTYIDENGEIDVDLLYNSFNPQEKKAIKTIQDINESMREKAVYTAAVIRGDRINPLNNYIHHFVIYDTNPDENLMGTQMSENYNNSLRPSTRAQSLVEREKTVSPLHFDVFASAQRGAKFVLLDYTMTKPIRTARKTLAVTRTKLEELNEGRIPKEQRDVFNAIESAFDEVVRNVLTNNFITDSFADEVVNFISKSGYRAILASVPRFIAELSSNIGFVMIANPKDFIAGTKYKSIVLSPSAVLILDNVGSKQTNRLFHGDTLGGRFIDKTVLSQSTGVKGATAKSDVMNVTNMIYNSTVKKYKNAVELLADTLISTPDKLVMRPLWFGVFANEFKNQTGEDVDFNKIASNDESYMNEYKDALNKAKDKADEQTVLAGATDNPFMGMLKGTIKPNQSFLTRFFNNFNNFMTRFAIYEYTTARQGLYAAMGNGTISRRQGVALLSGVATRMTLYTLLTQMLSSFMLSLFGADDEENEKTFTQKFGQSLSSTATGLILGRDFGNASKSLINYGVEKMNERFLTALREGEYDPYKDAISYSIIPKEKQGKKTTLTDFITQMGGSFGPSLKTADLIARKAFEAPKKEEEAIERTNQEIGVRIPLEVLGHLGYVPLYKDIRKVVIDQMYRDLEHADKRASDKKQAEKEMLHGYENRTDMKRYNPELYEEIFGKNSPGYDAKKAKENIKKAKEKIERERKDAMYNYTPKKKAITKKSTSSFGSKKFGDKTK